MNVVFSFLLALDILPHVKAGCYGVFHTYGVDGLGTRLGCLEVFLWR
jgi:hypothetical protein